MSPYIWVFFKRGFLNDHMIDGMPTTYYDPDEWGHNTDSKIQFHLDGLKKFMLKVYFGAKLSKALKPYIRESMEEIGDDDPYEDQDIKVKKINSNYKSCKRRINFSALGVRIGDPTLHLRLATQDLVDIVDLTFMDVSDLELLKASFYNDGYVEDVNLVSSGVYTIGSGGDYSDWDAFRADITTQTGELEGRAISAFTTPINLTFVHDNAGHDFKLTSDTAHNGDVNSGWLHTVASSGQWLINSTTGAGNFIIDGINFDFSTNGTLFKYRIICSNAGKSKAIIKNNIMNLAGGNEAAVILDRGDNYCVNNKIFNNISNQAITMNSNGTSDFVDHCTLYNTGRGVYVGTNTVTNTASFGATLTNAFNFCSTGTGYNNAADDTSCEDADFATGSGNLTGLTTSNQFLSLVNTSSDFLKIKDSLADIYQAGSLSNSYLSTDIAGVTYTDPCSIGCHEFGTSGQPAYKRFGGVEYFGFYKNRNIKGW